jgi:hypothetical protein
VLAGLMYRVVSDWALALGGVVLINLGLLVGVLVLLRRWWRTLSLPRSREALIGLWRDNDDNRTRGENADTHRSN